MGQTLAQKIIARASGLKSVEPGDIVTANVMMMIGAAPDGGVNLMPIKPANPIADTMENTITTSDTNVPETVRVARKMASIMARNMSGISVPES